MQLSLIVDFILTTFGATLIALITVPAMRGLKWAAPAIGRLGSGKQQIIVVGIAAALTLLGTWANVSMPTDISLIQAQDIEGLLAAGIAMIMHRSAKEAATTP